MGSVFQHEKPFKTRRYRIDEGSIIGSFWKGRLKESKININKHYTYCQPAGSASLICMVTISTTNTNLSTSNATRSTSRGKSDQTPREIAAFQSMFESGRIQDDPNKSSPFNDSNPKKIRGAMWQLDTMTGSAWFFQQLVIKMSAACSKPMDNISEVNLRFKDPKFK